MNDAKLKTVRLGPQGPFHYARGETIKAFAET